MAEASQGCPLVFDMKLPIAGYDFVAGVRMKCATLAEEEDSDEWVAWGVFPGGLVGLGRDMRSACQDLRERIRLVLADIASDAVGFNGFKKAVEDFYGSVDEETRRGFDEARRRVRAGELNELGLPKVSNPAFEIEVVRIGLEGPDPKVRPEAHYNEASPNSELAA